MTLQAFLVEIRVRVNELIEEEPANAPEGPSFVWQENVATWRRRHQWARISESPAPNPLGNQLLVLGRDPAIDLPMGHQADPHSFFAEPDRVDAIARMIASHFAWPA